MLSNRICNEIVDLKWQRQLTALHYIFFRHQQGTTEILLSKTLKLIKLKFGNYIHIAIVLQDMNS